MPQLPVVASVAAFFLAAGSLVPTIIAQVDSWKKAEVSVLSIGKIILKVGHRSAPCFRSCM